MAATIGAEHMRVRGLSLFCTVITDADNGTN